MLHCTLTSRTEGSRATLSIYLYCNSIVCEQESFIKHQTQTVQLFWNPCPSNYNQQARYQTEQRNLTFNVTDLEVMGIR